MEIPDAIMEFLEEAIILDNGALPQRYPEPDDLDPFQVGFRVDSSGVDLVGDLTGWDDDWWVIGLNRWNNPYFVDLSEAPEFPVAFTYHGCERWQPVPVSDSLGDFTYILSCLQDLEADPRAAVAWLEEHVDTDSELWGDVCSVYIGEGDQVGSRPRAVDLEENNFIYGHAVVTSLGDRPKAVLTALGQLMNLKPKELDRLATQSEIAVRHDRFINLRDLINQLTELGAMVIFDEDEKEDETA